MCTNHSSLCLKQIHTDLMLAEEDDIGPMVNTSARRPLTRRGSDASIRSFELRHSWITEDEDLSVLPTCPDPPPIDTMPTRRSSERRCSAGSNFSDFSSGSSSSFCSDRPPSLGAYKLHISRLHPNFL